MLKARLLLFTILLGGMALSLGACSTGCVKCTGVTADEKHCKSDYQETADFNSYIQAYEEQGGVCEDL